MADARDAYVLGLRRAAACTRQRIARLHRGEWRATNQLNALAIDLEAMASAIEESEARDA